MRHALTVTSCLIALAWGLSACGGDDSPDTDGELTAKELVAKVPSASQDQLVAADLVAAKEAADLPADTDPLELGQAPNDLRFAFSAMFGLRSVSQLIENPVRSAMDHSLITAYAGHPFLADDAVTLVSTSQPFDEISSSLEDEGWTRDGDVVSTDDDPSEITYTAVGAGDGFLVLGYDPEVVASVASGDAEPTDSETLEIVEGIDAPVAFAEIPGSAELDCVVSDSFSDEVNGEATFTIEVEGTADELQLPKPLESDLDSLGFDVEISTEDNTVTLELTGQSGDQGVTTPAGISQVYQDAKGPLLYDCG